MEDLRRWVWGQAQKIRDGVRAGHTRLGALSLQTACRDMTLGEIIEGERVEREEERSKAGALGPTSIWRSGLVGACIIILFLELS